MRTPPPTTDKYHNSRVCIYVSVTKLMSYLAFFTIQKSNLLVWFYAEMYSGVLREVTGVGECFAALGTLVRLGLPHVDLGVQLKIGLGTENLEKQENQFSKGETCV